MINSNSVRETKGDKGFIKFLKANIFSKCIQSLDEFCNAGIHKLGRLLDKVKDISNELELLK